MKKKPNFIFPTLVIVYALTIISYCSGCGKPAADKEASAAQTQGHGAFAHFESFRDIPGVTGDEIKAVEKIIEQRSSFTYGMTPACEAFYGENGEVQGFTAYVTEWLAGLFDVPFKPALYSWVDLRDGLKNGSIDFAGNLTASDERRKTYAMTDAIARRSIKYIRLASAPPLADVAVFRTRRFVFLNESTTFRLVSPHISGVYESVFADGYEDVYNMLKNNEADAFIAEGADEAAFDHHGDVVANDFYPLIYTPVSLSTQNKELAPVISVVQKALLSEGVTHYLAELYNDGYNEYLKRKMARLITEEERLYMQSHPVVQIAYETGNYPVSFYNARDKRWEGIALEVLREVEAFTGLRFERVNDEHAVWADLLKMLEEGKASMISELIWSEERAKKFIWSDATFMVDNPALISKVDYPNIHLNEIIYAKIGLVTRSQHTELFHGWFPEHPGFTEYESSLAAFNALDSGEVDMVMTSSHELLIMTHYFERADYKANFVFEHKFRSTFGFNKDQAILCSIIDKALRLIDTELVASQWMRKTYDYRIKLAEARLPWFLGACGLLICVLTLLFVQFNKKRGEGKRLATLVAEQTEEARKASEAKSLFIANMNHEMRTPMNVIVGLTDLLLEDDSISGTAKETLKKINTASTTLMGLINDVLDMSKIESGKLELMPDKYDAPSMLNDIITLNLIRIQDKPITFNLNIDENLPANLFGDDLRVKQILNNLLNNAFKYTKEGTVTLSVSGRRDGGDMWLAFCISDTGIGIRKDDIAKLFTDYNQVDTRANRNIEGTGLGLSIAKKFVELMDGSIAVESEYGKGTTFHVNIRQGFVSDHPIGKDVVENLRGFHFANRDERMRKKLTRLDLSGVRVLVVDDFPTNLDVAARMLRKYNMAVDCVDGGQKAIDSVMAGAPAYDAIFMDHMMPGMDGIEAAAAIRALPTAYAKSLPIIALTANAVAGNERMFLDNGFDAFLSKPINVVMLDAVVRRCIGSKAKEQ
jgi:signal transduction histidine kinase/CheY-like chemotaxis protein